MRALYLGHWATVSERGGQQEVERQMLHPQFFVCECGAEQLFL